MAGRVEDAGVIGPPRELPQVRLAREQAARSAARGARLALIAMAVIAVLGTVKLIAGVRGHSNALIADGVESLLDIVSALTVWGSLKIAAADPNRRFPYGYGKAEPLGGLLIAAGLLFVAFLLAIECIHEIRTPHESPAAWTLIVLTAVVAVKEVMFRWLVRAGRELGSSALQSDAWHHRSDALTSLAAFVGILIAIVGGEGYEAADDWAALAACGLIAFNGAKLLRSALAEVLDAAPNDATLLRIRAVASEVAGVRGIDECRARKSGLGWLVDIHVEVDGELPVREGHRIAHEVKDALLASNAGILDALVHVEPA